jgi:hypothetical protein
MRRLIVLLAVCAAISGIAPLAALAEPPNPPPGCGVVVTTPGVTTGSAQGQANKQETYARLCT